MISSGDLSGEASPKGARLRSKRALGALGSHENTPLKLKGENHNASIAI